MTEDLKVKLTLTAEGQQKPETTEFVPTYGAKMELGFGDAETTWRLDYRQPDVLRLRIDGKVVLIRKNDLEITAGGRVTRDFIDKTSELKGSLEMVFNRNIEVAITGSTGPAGNNVGAGLVIAF
ncbi:MAG: hypothetical protein IH969_10495 [Candidatus Krumholzibacteriota bacterium]|nr:hypothetical protein [Candidatus Krumholzibacteriota bacterium]